MPQNAASESTGEPEMIDHTRVGVGDFERAEAFHVAAPGSRPDHPNYHGAFVHCPDGHDSEAVCHEPEDDR